LRTAGLIKVKMHQNDLLYTTLHLEYLDQVLITRGKVAVLLAVPKCCNQRNCNCHV